MAIICDVCRKEAVAINGDICSKCQEAKENPNGGKFAHLAESIYLEPELFQRFKQIHADIQNEKKGAKTAMGKFLNLLKTSFINQETGAEINDPTPIVVIPQHKTLDRIQHILNHNLAVYAAKNDLDTPESLDDWTVNDMYSDEWEQSLYQHVENVTIMASDDPEPNDQGLGGTENPPGPGIETVDPQLEVPGM